MSCPSWADTSKGAVPGCPWPQNKEYLEHITQDNCTRRAKLFCPADHWSTWIKLMLYLLHPYIRESASQWLRKWMCLPCEESGGQDCVSRGKQALVFVYNWVGKTDIGFFWRISLWWGRKRSTACPAHGGQTPLLDGLVSYMLVNPQWSYPDWVLLFSP